MAVTVHAIKDPSSEEGLTSHPYQHSFSVSIDSVSIPYGQTFYLGVGFQTVPLLNQSVHIRSVNHIRKA
jgi:hypothetical protein